MNSAINWLEKCITKEQDKITNAVLQNQKGEHGKEKTSECHGKSKQSVK